MEEELGGEVEEDEGRLGTCGVKEDAGLGVGGSVNGEKL